MTTFEHPDQEDVMAWIDGELAGDRRVEVATHLAACDACQSIAGQLRDVSRQLSSWQVDPSSSALADRVREAARTWRPRAGELRPSSQVISARRSSWRWRRQLGWIAAVVVIALASTLRIDCAPGPVCDVAHMTGVSFRAPLTSSSPLAAPPLRPGPQGSPGAVKQDPTQVAAIRKAFEDDWAARPRLTVSTPQDGAKVVIVIFIDWQCHACEVFYWIYAPVVAKYEAAMPGAVRVVTRDYPLNSACNANLAVTMHPAACEAAAAVRMARDKGKADDMIAWLFANQAALTPERVKSAATTVAGITDFDQQYTARLDEIRRDTAAGGDLKVTSTPTCYINGVRVNGADGKMPTATQLEWAIEYELRKAAKVN